MRLDRDNLIRARERRGYAIETLAEEAGIAKNSVLRAEHGEDIRPLTARKIAAALGVTVADLYEEAGHPKAGAPPSSEPTFNDVLDEERRAYSWRAWTEYIQATADRWESEYLNSNGTHELSLARELSYQALALTYTIRESVVRPGFEEMRAGLMDRATEGAFRRELAVLLEELNRLSDVAAAIADSARQQKAEAQQLQRQHTQTKQTLRVIEGELSASA